MADCCVAVLRQPNEDCFRTRTRTLLHKHTHTTAWHVHRVSQTHTLNQYSSAPETFRQLSRNVDAVCATCPWCISIPSLFFIFIAKSVKCFYLNNLEL